MNLSHSLTENIHDMVKWVETVTFSSGGEDKGVGLRFIITDVAEGLKMAVSSSALDIGTPPPTPPPGAEYKPLEKGEATYFTNHTGWKMEPRTDVPDGKLDFTFYFKPKDYDETDKVLTLRNVVPGTPYTVIEGKVEIVFDWTEAVINPGDEGKLSGAIEMDLNFGGGENTVLDDLVFEGIKAQLFIIGPDGFDPNLYFNISYGPWFGKNQKPFGLAGKEIEAIPSFDLNIVEGETYRNLPVVYNLLEGGEPISGFDDVMNSRSKMKIDYTITVNSLPIKSADIETSQKITAQMVILLPMQFKINPNAAGLVFDTSGDDDLFRRDPGDNSIFDTLKSLRFTLWFRQDENLFTSGKLYLVDKNNIGTPDLDPLGLLFDFSSDDNPGIYLSNDEIPLVKDMYPYIPNFLIVSSKDGNGDNLPLKFRRNGRVGGISVTVEAETDMETDDIFAIF
jgi:hypothetical protein